MAKRKPKPEDLRKACVDEALAIIGESGLEHLSLREVARRLNVSHQAPYKHFRSRDHILAEVVSRAYSDFADHLDRRPRSTDPREDMANMGRAYLEYAQRYPLHYRLMFETPLPDSHEHPEMMLRAEHAFSLLKGAIARLPNRADDDTPLDLDALFVWSVMHGLAGILRGGALQVLGIPESTLESAVAIALWRIGVALGVEEK
jgi:AcrR family transcriptional regulator